MADGKPFVDALDNTGMFSAVNMRMINIAFSTGTLDRTMATIAENAEKKVSAVIQTSVARFEPTMVIIMAVAVGFILVMFAVTTFFRLFIMVAVDKSKQLSTYKFYLVYG